MFPILDLPNELIRRIIELVHPDDMETFALLNRLVYALATDTLSSHNALKKRYSSLKISYLDYDHSIAQAQRSRDSNHALLLLASIFKNPDVAYYPEVIHVGSCDDSEGGYASDAEDVSRERESAVRQYSVQLRNMVDANQLIDEDLKEDMGDSISHSGSESVAVTLLMTLLPNLRHIDLCSWSAGEDTELLHNVIYRIAKANWDSTSTDYGKALSRLQSLSMNAFEVEDGEDINGFIPFALLPSMRTLRGHKVRGDDDLIWPTIYHPQPSTVTEINLKDSCVEASCFESLFAGIAALKTFAYEHGGSEPSAWKKHVHYRPIAIIDALSKHASHSLEALGIDCNDGMLDEEDEDELPESLRSFTRLKSIRLEDRLFQNLGRVGSEDGSVVVRLVDYLPASTTTFTLVQLDDPEFTMQLLEGLPQEKAEKLPKLVKLIFESPHPLDGVMKVSLQAAGISLWSWKTPMDNFNESIPRLLLLDF